MGEKTANLNANAVHPPFLVFAQTNSYIHFSFLVFKRFILLPSCSCSRVRKNFWQSCTATWRSTGLCTTRHSVPQRCPPSSRITACYLSRNFSSSSERPRCACNTDTSELWKSINVCAQFLYPSGLAKTSCFCRVGKRIDLIRVWAALCKHSQSADLCCIPH